MGIKWEHRYEHLDHLPEYVLFSLARNEAAPVEFRRTALEIMVSKGFKSAENPIFRGLGLDFEVIEVPEIVPVQEESGPLKASVTTETLYGNKIIDNKESFLTVDTFNDPPYLGEDYVNRDFQKVETDDAN